MISSSIDALSVCMHGAGIQSKILRKHRARWISSSLLYSVSEQAQRTKRRMEPWRRTAEKKAVKLESLRKRRRDMGRNSRRSKSHAMPSSPRARSPTTPREHGAGQVGVNVPPHARPPPATPPPMRAWPGGHGVGWTLARKLRAAFHCSIPVPRVIWGGTFATNKTLGLCNRSPLSRLHN